MIVCVCVDRVLGGAARGMVGVFWVHVLVVLVAQYPSFPGTTLQTWRVDPRGVAYIKEQQVTPATADGDKMLPEGDGTDAAVEIRDRVTLDFVNLPNSTARIDECDVPPT